jgi:hypothetical protein
MILMFGSCGKLMSLGTYLKRWWIIVLNGHARYGPLKRECSIKCVKVKDKKNNFDL